MVNPLRRFTLFDLVNYSLFLVLSAVMLYPWWHELMLSFSSRDGALQGGMYLLPKGGFNLHAYESLLASGSIVSGFENSLFVTAVHTVLTVLVTMLAAYPLSKAFLPGRKSLTLFILFTMMFSGGLIPTYLLVRSVGLIDSLWSLIWPSLTGGYMVFVMRGFFEQLPGELEEAAVVDGAGLTRIFFSIVVPLSKPVMATIGLWAAVNAWNSFFDAAIYINAKSLYPLSLVLREILVLENSQQFNTTNGAFSDLIGPVIQAATIVIATAPILLVYPFLQRYFVKGMLIGAVKG